MTQQPRLGIGKEWANERADSIDIDPGSSDCLMLHQHSHVEYIEHSTTQIQYEGCENRVPFFGRVLYAPVDADPLEPISNLLHFMECIGYRST